MNNISDNLDYLFKKRKNDIFIEDSINNRSFTYQEFLDLVLCIKEFLNSQNVGENDKVCYYAENSVITLALQLAVLFQGAVIALIDPLKGKDEVENIIQRVSPKLILKLDDLLKLDVTKSNDLCVDFSSINYKKPYLITFTSGSTAEAKGVINSFENLYLSALDFGKEFCLTQENKFYHNFPMAYMAGVLNTFVKPMIFGCKIVVAERLSFLTAMKFWGEIQKYEVNTFWINPTFVATLMKLDRDIKNSEYTKNNKITIFCGTAPLDKILKKKFEEKYGTKLYESYGLSETLFISTNTPKLDVEGAVGKVLDNTELVFGENGEIKIRTPWMFLGYLGKEEFLKESFYSTGDVGIIEDGVLRITGRISDIIIKGGVNISPKRIEEVVSHFVSEFVVLGLKDEFLGERIACFYVDDIDEKIINSKILEMLGKDFTIDSFYKISEIPKNINGKIDKLALKKEYSK